MEEGMRRVVIYSKLTPVDQLRVGDIITFLPPERSSPVTHRIALIEPGRDGSRIFQTKGDHNGATDPWKMTLNEPVQARYVLHVPYFGYLLGALAMRDVRLVVISLPATLIALTLLWSLWRKPQVDLGWAEDDDVAACDGVFTTWGDDA
jgi:signal peptidase